MSLSIKILNFLLILYLLQPSICFAEIIKTRDIKVVDIELSKATEDSLVIFDLDEVLITTEDQIFLPKYRTILLDYDKEFSRRFSKYELMNIWSEVFLAHKMKLVEPRMLDIISDLKQKNIFTIALTNSATGKIGKITHFEDWRINELEKNWNNF